MFIDAYFAINSSFDAYHGVSRICTICFKTDSYNTLLSYDNGVVNRRYNAIWSRKSKIPLINVISIYIDAYFWASPYEPNNFNTGAIIIMNGLEVNDDYGGCQEDPGEPNSVVRRQDYYLDY